MTNPNFSIADVIFSTDDGAVLDAIFDATVKVVHGHPWNQLYINLGTDSIDHNRGFVAVVCSTTVHNL